MESAPITFLPSGFDYYAGGHVHIVKEASIPGYKNIVYPGPTFPNNFHELEELEHGGYYLYDEGNLEYVPIRLKEIIKIDINADEKTPEQVKSKVFSKVDENDINDKLILLRVHGCLISGKPADINFLDILDYCKGSYCVLKNTYKLKTKEFEDIEIKTGTADEIEEALITEHAKNKHDFVKQLMDHLNKDKNESETKPAFETRLVKEIDSFLEAQLYF